MNALLEAIAATLASARQKKELSQRALGAKVGIPQSHLSKIENADVDLQTSSLIELARALDLELMLVPRLLVPTVESLCRGVAASSQGSPSHPMYELGENDEF